MAERKKESNPDIISSIFERRDKKKVSSLFAPKAPKGRPISSADVPAAAHAANIKKRLPLGLDIGTSSIKAVQLGYDHANRLNVTGIINENIPVEAQSNPRERDRVIADILKKVVHEKGLKGNCYAASSWMNSRVNLIMLPKMPYNEIDKAVRWEARQASGGNINELSLDYIVLEGQKPELLGNQIGVLTITAPKKEIFERMALLESAGLVPLAVDIDQLASLSVLDYTRKLNPNEITLFLDFGSGKTSLNIISNDELVYTRLLKVTGNSLTKVVTDYCNVSWIEAQTLKEHTGLLAPNPEQLSDQPSAKIAEVRNAILPLLEDMVQDIDHAFKYFTYQVTQARVTRYDKVILGGGSARLNGIVPFLNNRLNINVEVIDGLMTLDSLEPGMRLALYEIGPCMDVAFGLALRGVG